MTDKDYIVELRKRRGFFQLNFPLNIGRKRGDVNSYEVLKNSCPVCGYLTLSERDAFDICGICFWEDDGVDDFEADADSGPNHMTLAEGRAIFFRAKKTLATSVFAETDYIQKIQSCIRQLDELIGGGKSDELVEIQRLQDQLLDMLHKHKIYGLENLFP